MHDIRPEAAAGPLLNPLLERLAFLETANDGLKSKLSAGGFGAEMQNLALREQLQSARTELARQQEALESFYRETLAAGQARDQARAAGEESLKAGEAAAQERDALRGRLEALEASLELARRGSFRDDARGLIDDLDAKLELARRAASDMETERRDSLRKAELESAERLRALAEESSEREALLLRTISDDRKTIEDHRRLLEEAEVKLESVRRAAEEAENARRLLRSSPIARPRSSISSRTTGVSWRP
jgi:chromosome segregation ATPase